MNDELTKAIATDLGIAELPAEEQQALIGQFGEVALKAATLAVVGKLADGKKEEFASLAQAGDPGALRAFLDKEVPDHEKIAAAAVADEVARFKSFQAP
ncbi:MAG TPA: hypothetical protein VFP46_01760 [Candidatus Paceibacterota bacterium]|nr:hypothetical protein [Candidatus Paceibacterota bacterium]